MSTDDAHIAQSVRQRLLNLAHKTGQDYNRLLVRYSLERLLYGGECVKGGADCGAVSVTTKAVGAGQ